MFNFKIRSIFLFRCVGIKCSSPPALPLGADLDKTEFSAGEEAGYSCQPGHQLHQPSPLVCDVNGKWKGPPAHCVPLICAGPGIIGNGTILIGTWTQEPLPTPTINLLTQSIEKRQQLETVYNIPTAGSGPLILNSKDRNTVYYPVGSEIWFSCTPGYMLIGLDTNICEDENSWQNQFPSCNEVVCPNINSILNGQITIEGFKYRQMVIYTCNEGYDLVGLPTRVCQESGLWSDSEPNCAPRMCQEPAIVDNGHIEDGYTLDYGSVMSYTCHPGFKLVGGKERVCGSSGQWSGQPPICINTSQTCLVPQLLNSGYISYDGNLEVGSVAWYDCNADFNIVGNYERTCLINGSWSGNNPICSPKFCTPIEYILHGKVMGKTFEQGSVLQFSCNSGYKMEGSETIECEDSGSWDQPLPVCVPVICPEPDQIENGVVRGSARRFEDSIVYECKPGHTLLGAMIRKCDMNGEWSNDEPYCALVTCPDLPKIPHGLFDAELRIPGEKARLKCDLGWIISGNNNVTCNSNGIWQGIMPRCIPAFCVIDISVTNASLPSRVAENYEVGSSLTWSCVDGQRMEGSNTITCLPNGEWDLDPPTCHINKCEDVLRLENGVIFGTKNNSKTLEVRFSCDNGYHKIMDSHLKCSLNGKWTGNTPICSKKICSNSFDVENSLVNYEPHGSSYKAQFSCNEQYELEGESSLICKSDNLWGAPPPKCELSHCPPFDHILKMNYERKKIRLGETMKFQCDPGFTLIGSSFVKCSRAGIWEQEFPHCQPGICQFESRIRHGAWKINPSQYKKSLWAKGLHSRDEKIKMSNGLSSLSVGDEIEVTCDHRYDVYGHQKVVCLNTLGLSSQVPKCRPVHCKKLANIINGLVLHNGTYKGASSTYKCNRGFELIGTEIRKCRRNRSWTRSPPSCKPIVCNKPHDIAHGEVDYNPNNLRYGSKVKFYCHIGYELTGLNERQCGENGNWEGEEPECVLIRCPPPKIPLHGEQDIHELTVGGTVSYNCNHGYRLEGTRILTCLNNKTWSGRVPSCIKVACQLPRNITSGFVSFSDMEYQANIEYSCHEGYVLSGYRARSCLYSGQWSGEEPRCVPSRCKPLGKLCIIHFFSSSKPLLSANVKILTFLELMCLRNLSRSLAVTNLTFFRKFVFFNTCPTKSEYHGILIIIKTRDL